MKKKNQQQHFTKKKQFIYVWYTTLKSIKHVFFLGCGVLKNNNFKTIAFQVFFFTTSLNRKTSFSCCCYTHHKKSANNKMCFMAKCFFLLSLPYYTDRKIVLRFVKHKKKFIKNLTTK